MYSPWTTSMPCLFSNHTSLNYAPQQQINSYFNSTDCLANSLHNLDLSNPFNIVAACSLNNLNLYHNRIAEQQDQELKSNYFEPLPFLDTQHQTKAMNYPQLSQKHTIVKQMIARKTYYNSCNNIFSSKKRQLCSFCKSNGESANVYNSHVLRNVDNEIECPVLMAYICPKCGATGKSAHTIKYCTALSENERVALPTVKLFREGRSSSGNMNLFKK